MVVIALLLFSTLFAIAVLHVAWAFGIRWPAKDEQSLINMVVGSPGMSKMPGFILTISVAFAIASAGIFALWGANIISLPLPEWMRVTSLIVLASIFALRGVSSYLPIGPLTKQVEPFRSLDRRYYAPLCLFISIGFFIIYAK